MADRYLVPCQCGAQIPVGVHQAGTEIRCQCGAELKAPPLRKLRELPLEESDAVETPGANWSVRKAVASSLLLLGVLLVAIGVQRWSVLPTVPVYSAELAKQNFAKQLEDASSSDLYRFWINFEMSLEDGGFKPPEVDVKGFYEDRREAALNVVYALFSSGGVLILIGLGLFLTAPRS
ncbi:hypothetical protein [Aeoliella mucimassa]|uniref:Uncharacterized protein n=1 Tax=Aeoliella mucimassa TaxID=2527972 RepID=A0A518AI82_9BACT|nr:hypothetical protein [Aeoliella mucimassa]QDU54443.1 hypothetical protein Pan181_06240 [Aeoliella mucimassa]